MSGTTIRSNAIRPLLPMAGLALLALAFPARAQAGEQTGKSAPICQLDTVEIAKGAPLQLTAVCGTRGLMLGPVSEFSVIANAGLDAMLVDVSFAGDRRILMLSIRKGGQLLVENLTGQIALAAGKGPMSEIDDVTVDLAGFVSAGTISVEKRQAEAAITEIGLGEQLTAELVFADAPAE